MNRRSLTGRIALEGAGAVTFESSLERDWLVVLDFDPTVTEIREQPFTLSYRVGPARRKYTPDVLATFSPKGAPSTTVVYEVKPRADLRRDWHAIKERFRAAIRHCKAEGWTFRIVTEREIRTPFLENARFLRRYRNLPRQETTCAQLLFTLRALGETTPQGLLAATYWNQEARMAALPMLWKLVAERSVGAALLLPVTMSSSIWLPE